MIVLIYKWSNRSWPLSSIVVDLWGPNSLSEMKLSDWGRIEMPKTILHSIGPRDALRSKQNNNITLRL